MNEGWVCPRCGRVNAPFTPYCNCKPSISNDICNHKWICTGGSGGATTNTTIYLKCERCGETKTERYRYDTGSGLI